MIISFEGIVICHENWGDADRLISFYTPHLGKTQAVAKGIRYEKSKLRGHLDLLAHGEFMIARRNGRGVITDAVSRGTFDAVRARIEIAYCAKTIADFYDAYLFPHAVDEKLWELLQSTLRMLAENDSLSPEGIGGFLETFAREFVRALGYYSGGEKIRSGESTLSAYDALLANTEVAGPKFSEVYRGMQMR